MREPRFAAAFFCPRTATCASNLPAGPSTCCIHHLARVARLNKEHCAVRRDRLLLAGTVMSRARQEADVRLVGPGRPRSAIGEDRELTVPARSRRSCSLRLTHARSRRSSAAVLPSSRKCQAVDLAGLDQRLNANTKTPAPTNRTPPHSRKEGRSPRNATAKRATRSTLSLSTGATFDASPIFRARK